MPSAARWFDWRCVMMMLPKRRFTAAELARAVPHSPSPSIVGAVLFNVLFVMAMYAVAFHAMVPGPIWFVMGFYLLGLLAGLWAPWHDPSCRAGRWAYYVMPMATAPALGATQLPPGLLLTLVENAVEHGVSPQLAGGSVQVSAWLEAGGLHIAIDDDGPGLPPLPGPAEGHVGLANSRARLAQAFGQHAELGLANRPEGGCRALLRLPLSA